MNWILIFLLPVVYIMYIWIVINNLDLQRIFLGKCALKYCIYISHFGEIYENSGNLMWSLQGTISSFSHVDSQLANMKFYIFPVALQCLKFNQKSSRALKYLQLLAKEVFSHPRDELGSKLHEDEESEQKSSKQTKGTVDVSTRHYSFRLTNTRFICNQCWWKNK